MVVIGGGNVAWHLSKQFSNCKSINLLQIYNRNILSISDLNSVATITDKVDEIKIADIYVLAISDNAIKDMLDFIPNKKALILHTSGTTSMNILNKFDRIGVFYPLQTLTKFNEIDFKNIPILIEAKHKDDLLILKNIANQISDNVQYINSEERKKIHLAAVFVNNFVNHLYSIGYEFLEENNINPSILIPLILETAQKLVNYHPKNIQTGPAKRKDFITIASQIEMLENKENKVIYKLLSDSISKQYE